MTSHVIKSYDSHHMIYDQRNHIHRSYSTACRNQLYSSYFPTLPIPSIDFCENLLYETKITEDLGSTTSSSYINSSLEHYDNTHHMHTYDNPIEYHESYTVKQSLINLPNENENFYDNTKMQNNKSSSNKSPRLFYLENKRLAISACLITLLLLLIIGLSIFLLNKYLRPVVIHTTVNNHYDPMNISNQTTTTTTTSTTILPIITALEADHLPFPYSTCPPDRWGIGCQNICKPCGLGVCHSVTGKCVCPRDLYGEFCDLWKVNDKPKRGDLTN